MKSLSFDLFYAWVFVGILATFGPPVGFARLAKKEQARLDLLRLHKRTDAPGQREVILTGNLRGAETRTSPLRRTCLAWRHEIYADRTVSSGGKTKKERQRICQHSQAIDLPRSTLELQDQRRFSFSGLALSYSTHASRGSVAVPAISCAAFRQSDLANATFVEYCLRDGDEAEVWACRGSDDTLRSCPDSGDSIYAPPGEGPIPSRVGKTLTPLCCASAWGLIGGGLLVAFLAERVQRTQRLKGAS